MKSFATGTKLGFGLASKRFLVNETLTRSLRISRFADSAKCDGDLSRAPKWSVVQANLPPPLIINSFIAAVTDDSQATGPNRAPSNRHMLKRGGDCQLRAQHAAMDARQARLLSLDIAAGAFSRAISLARDAGIALPK